MIRTRFAKIKLDFYVTKIITDFDFFKCKIQIVELIVYQNTKSKI